MRDARRARRRFSVAFRWNRFGARGSCNGMILLMLMLCCGKRLIKSILMSFISLLK